MPFDFIFDLIAGFFDIFSGLIGTLFSAVFGIFGSIL